ncbi:MAG: PaaX family transcriptional regulator C-terminal domain-containing protein [Rhizobiaceae bacterium]
MRKKNYVCGQSSSPFFGDAVLPRGGAVSAKTVQEVLLCMGIEAGAVRTAFSRLSKDGWVVRTKLGRSSFYHLSDPGLQPFADATDQIYAPLPEADNSLTEWTLTVRQDDHPDFQLFRQSPVESGNETFRMTGKISHVPDWMKLQKCAPDHARSFDNLMTAFQPVDHTQLNELEAMAVRCLLIHEWRRILFQFEQVAPVFWTQDWPQSTCHAFVAALYHNLLHSSEVWMDQNAKGPQGRLRSPGNSLGSRFN